MYPTLELSEEQVFNNLLQKFLSPRMILKRSELEYVYVICDDCAPGSKICVPPMKRYRKKKFGVEKMPAVPLSIEVQQSKMLSPKIFNFHRLCELLGKECTIFLFFESEEIFPCKKVKVRKSVEKG